MSKQRPSIFYEANSAFAAVNGNRIVVLEAHPHDGTHYLVVDRKDVSPLFDTEDGNEAKAVAQRYAALADLAMVVEGLTDKSADIFLYSNTDMAKSPEGLPLLSGDLLLGHQSLQAASDLTRLVDEDLNGPGLSELAASIAEKCEGNPRPQSLVFSFYLAVVSKEDTGSSVENENIFVHLGLQWDDNGSIIGVRTDLLDEDCEIGGQPLYKLLYAIDTSPTHEVWFDDPEDKADWADQIAAMPEFSKVHQNYPDARVFAYEGGEVLRHLAQSPQGSALLARSGDHVAPLRVVHVPPSGEFSEAVLRADQQQLASQFFSEKLFAHVHRHMLEEQHGRSYVMGQEVSGTHFSVAARFPHDVVLETALQPDPHGDDSSRQWLSYRLWVGDLLVMDVQPGNEQLYAERGVSLPLTASLPLSEVQIGQVMLHALAPADSKVEGPELFQQFLQSPLADQLRFEAGRALDREADARFEQKGSAHTSTPAIESSSPAL